MSPEEKAARPPLQAMLPALKPALIFECVGVPGLIATGVRRRAARRPHRRGRRLHGERPLRADARHFEGAQRSICAGLYAGRIRLFAAPDRGRQVDAASLVTGSVGIDGVAQGVRRSRQSGSPHQDHRRAVAVIVVSRKLSGKTRCPISRSRQPLAARPCRLARRLRFFVALCDRRAYGNSPRRLQASDGGASVAITVLHSAGTSLAAIWQRIRKAVRIENIKGASQ